MRPGQQNKRMRGRNRGKGPNPLTRSYESNGPDVKIRGTALHIAEKYVTLARDAQASGDRVMAESYLQHAEHYFRMISAAQAALQQAQNPQPGYRPYEDEDDDIGEEDDRFSDRFGRPEPDVAAEPQGYVNGNGGHPGGGPQPQMASGWRDQSERAERPAREDRGPREDRRNFDRNREGRNRDRNQNDRGYGAEGRSGGDRPQGERPARFSEPRGERQGGERQEPRERTAQPAAEDVAQLPRFVTGDPAPSVPAAAAPPEPVAAAPAAAFASEAPAPQPQLDLGPAQPEVPAVAAAEDEETGIRPRRRRAGRGRGRKADAEGETPESAVEVAAEE